MAKETDVAASNDVKIGEITPAKLGRSKLVLTRLPSGELRAISGRCPHQGADLEYACITGMATGRSREQIDMTRDGEVMRCPWHGFEFDLETGEPAVSPPEATRMRLRLYDVSERDGRIFVLS